MVLLQMTASASVLIAVLAVVRAALLHSLPKELLSALWLLPLARLLLPFFPAASFSLAALLGLGESFIHRPPLASGGLAPPQLLFPGGIPPLALPPTAAPLTSLAKAAPPLDWLWPVLATLWAVGAILLAAMILGRHLMLRRNYRNALPVLHPAVLHWQKEHPLGRRVEVRQSHHAQSPLTYGVWRPVILLPVSFDLSQEPKLRCVLAHEYRHIRRGDTLTKWLLAAALCLHWFNPLVWWMYRKASLDIELACDAGVLRTLGSGSKALYATLLLELEQEKAAALSLASSFRPTATEERMIAMIRQKKLHPLTGLLILVLVLALTGMVATGAPNTTPANPPPVSQSWQGLEEVPLRPEHLAEKEAPPAAQKEAQPPAQPIDFTPEELALIQQFMVEGRQLSPMWSRERDTLFELAAGTPVPAPVSGTVVETCDWAKWPFGLHIVLRLEDGTSLTLSHLSQILVEPGTWVEQGDPIGKAGTSGAISHQGYGIYIYSTERPE